MQNMHCFLSKGFNGKQKMYVPDTSFSINIIVLKLCFKKRQYRCEDKDRERINKEKVPEDIGNYLKYQGSEKKEATSVWES